MMEKVMELEHQKKLSKLYKNKRFLMNKLIANILWSLNSSYVENEIVKISFILRTLLQQ